MDIDSVATEIAQIALKAERWLNFAEACAWIGFGLSMIALVYLLVSSYLLSRPKPKHGKGVR